MTVICCVAAVVHVSAAGRARLTQLVGKAEVRVTGAASWREARVDMPVSEKNDIRTYLETEAEITFDNGTKIKIGENSVVTLARLFEDSSSGRTQSTVKVATGKIWASVKKLNDTRSGFDFETPTAVASIRGTRLGISVDRVSTVVDVYEGMVAVKKKGGKKSVNVSPNTRAVVEKSKNEISVLDFRNLPPKSSGTGSQNEAPVDPYAPVNGEKTIPTEGQSAPSVVPADSAGTKSPAVEPPATSPEEEPLPEQGSNLPVQPEKKLMLVVTAPEEGSTLHEPLIVVKGRTVPDAKIFVNDQQAQVGRDGSFMHRLPLPDEPYTYTIEIRAEYEGKQTVQQRSVTYAPKRQKLFLDCTSPVDGMEVTGKTVRCAGKTAPMSSVLANGMPVSVSAAGVFSRDIPLTEKDIGEYTLEVVARNDDDEILKTFTLDVTPRSPQINTSVPVILFSSGGQRATTQNFMAVQVLDRTPQDELTVTFTNNGVADRITTVNGRTEKLSLDEGKNVYSIQVIDMAGNNAPTARGEIYYLPGPLKLLLVAPASNYTLFEGLPPMMHPGYNEVDEPLDVEIEIDDGIGTVPESIRYCKVTGNGHTVILRNNNDYLYKGKVGLLRGTNAFTVQAEDLSGRLETLKFTVVVK